MMKIRGSYKRPVAFICSINAFLVVYVIYGLLIIPQNLRRSQRDLVATISLPVGNVTVIPVRYTREEIERISSAEAARRALDAVDLAKRVEELRLESSGGTLDMVEASDQVELELMDESSENETQKAPQAADLRSDAPTGSNNRSKEWDDTDNYGLDPSPSTAEVSGAQRMQLDKGKLVLHGPEIEDGIIPGKPLPPECNGQAHTDYDGFAVTWGLTHRQESAADCCLACLAQAKKAKKGQKKCNIWVYCPAEEGCYSPDIYVHKEFECWLKQDDEPRLNFKGRYDHEYRQAHPNCPLVVPWASGVIGS